jgi:hypothetical protein
LLTVRADAASRKKMETRKIKTKMVDVLSAINRSSAKRNAKKVQTAGYVALGGALTLAAFMFARGMRGSVPKTVDELEKVLQSYDLDDGEKAKAIAGVDEEVRHKFLRKYPAFANLLSGEMLVRAVCAVVECCEYLEPGKINELLEVGSN